MAERNPVISDQKVAAVLRPFVRAAGPMVETLRSSDPFRLRNRTVESGQPSGSDPTRRERLLDALASMRVPGSAEWDRMTPAERADWWVNRVGRFGAALAAVPGLAGALSDRLPLRDILGLATQGILLCAIASEYGVTDRAEQVRLLAWVLFERDIDHEVAAGGGQARATDTEDAEDAEMARLGAEMSQSAARHGRVTFKAAARTVWRFGRGLFALYGELDKRPDGRMRHEALGMLPVVGLLGDYLGERAGLKRAAARARRWLNSRT